MADSHAIFPTRNAVIGSPSNFWLHHTTAGFDLTHPPSPTTPIATPTLTIQTTTVPITVDPAKSALIIIDMQNFFLSPAIGRTRGAGHIACENLIKHAIPAARTAGMRVLWVNWGLTEEDVRDMPPSVTRCFGFHSIPEADGFTGAFSTMPRPNSVSVDRFGVEKKQGSREGMYHGLGEPYGLVTLENGEKVDGGRLLMRGSWNAEIYPPLHAVYTESLSTANPDVLIPKNRMSGMWNSDTPLAKFLEKEGIRTLFFTGVNTDQCVGGTLTDSFSRGYDCVLVGDGCGTTSPEHAQRAWEFNASRTYGFCVTSEEIAKGVERMERNGK